MGGGQSHWGAWRPREVEAGSWIRRSRLFLLREQQGLRYWQQKVFVCFFIYLLKTEKDVQ